MAIAPVTVSPEVMAWGPDFADNFSALQGIALAPAHPLYAQFQHIKNVAGSLHWQISQWAKIGQTDPERASAGLRAMSNNVYQWLNLVNDFASQLRGETTNTDTLTAIEQTATDWADQATTWVGEFSDWTGRQVQATAQEFQQLAADLESAGNFLAGISWVGVGILLLGIFLGPPLVDLVMGDE